jgi:hypothetical protein
MKKLILIGYFIACNQEIYDMIYRNVVSEAIKQGATNKAMEERNRTIELLRKLCNGQKSSWEGK